MTDRAERPLDPFRYRIPDPPRAPRRPAGGLRHERHRPRSRRRLFGEARALHADASRQLRAVDGAIEALVDERLACLDTLVDCRDQLRIRFSERHSRRRASVDEAPFPDPSPRAKPLHGIDIRSVALTLLRRHGPQRLRDLHALVHLYGYRIDSKRPVQRLADAMAYELRQGRVDRIERGIYAASEPHVGPDRYVPPSTDLDAPFPWSRPDTGSGAPHLDPDVAHDPELWAGAEWPTEEDIPDVPPAPAPAEAPPPPSPTLGDDSPTIRRPAAPDGEWRWEPPP